MKILGGFDIIIALILIFGNGIAFPWKVLFILGALTLVKSGLGMLKDFGSWIDFLCGICVLLTIIISIPWFISLIFGILIAQKGIVSFF